MDRKKIRTQQATGSRYHNNNCYLFEIAHGNKMSTFTTFTTYNLILLYYGIRSREVNTIL